MMDIPGIKERWEGTRTITESHIKWLQTLLDVPSKMAEAFTHWGLEGKVSYTSRGKLYRVL